MSDTRTKRAALMVAVSGSIATPLMVSSMNVALPSIGHEFRMDAVLLSWVQTANLLAAVIFLVPLGKVADMYGRKKVYACGMFIFVLASLVAAASVSASMLLALRFVQGLARL
jgi:MFS family permease